MCDVTEGKIGFSSKSYSIPVLLGALILLGPAKGVSAQTAADVKGSADHPMISRIEGATIINFDQKDFDEYRVITGAVSGIKEDYTRWPDEEVVSDRNSVRVEGKVWKLTYRVPKTRSTLEIIRSYQSALAKVGFEVLYECANRECAGPEPKRTSAAFDLTSIWLDAFTHALMSRGGFTVTGGVANNRRYLAARLSRAEGDVYVSAFAIGLDTPLARVDVVEVKPRDPDLVNVTAEVMATTIATRGSVALYGIYFDNDQASVKAESRTALAEIAKLLKDNAKLDLIVVGHTDHVGTYEHNLDLSLRRAQSVVEALTLQHGVARARLEPRGVGFLVPIAPNTSEGTRAKNRRVELMPKR